MLTQIICDRFADEFKTINFRAGLNTILGSTNGSNALGKSTFLWIIDFVFGGNGYCASGSDIQQNVRDHTIYFTFLFDETYHYFRRNTETSQTVSRCDMSGNFIKPMSLDEYRKFLAENYHLGIPFKDIIAHFFRVYGKENTYEKIPYLAKPRDVDEKAVDFLLKLFEKGTVLTALRVAEDEIGIKESQWAKAKQSPKSFEMIEQNETAIASLEMRLKQLMGQDGRTGIQYLGLGNDSYKSILKLQRELRRLTKRREQLKIKLDAIQNGNRDFINSPIAEDFQELTDFFPEANIKELSRIENFHRQLHVILQREIDEEVERLRPLIDRCERDIAHITERLETSGIATEVTQRILTQGINIRRQIEKLQEENCQLAREKELQEQRILSERRLEKLIADRVAATEEVVGSINEKLFDLNTLVTGDKEAAPVLEINRQKEISFGTRGNTSEGTAYKSMVLYDLSILMLTNVPVLIHDSNILHSISREHLKAIIRLYQTSGKQIFIAVDRENLDELTDSVVLELSEDHELFGYSWSRKKT